MTDTIHPRICLIAQARANRWGVPVYVYRQGNSVCVSVHAGENDLLVFTPEKNK